MLIKELVAHLLTLDQEKKAMILDGSNGGGHPRTINIGPCEQAITASDIDATDDCEEFAAGDVVICMGFGSY